jgi:Flp pilus assembly protein TadD
MKRSCPLGVAGLGLLLAIPHAAQAQLDSSTVRGQVVDDKGQPIPDVKIDLEYKGESRQKITKTAATDKKGSFLRVGLKPGPWQLAFNKEGFKPFRMETSLSGGGISEIPPITLAPAGPAAAAGPAGPVLPPSATGGEPSAKQAERVKQLGDNYNKAVTALRANQLDEAETLFKSVIAEFPDLPDAHHNLGYLYGKKNDVPAAEAEYRKAIELQPKAPVSYIALANLLAQKKREDDALKLMQDARDNFAADAMYQFALGAIAFNLGRGAEAEPAFLKVAELDPANVDVHFYLGSLALGRNDVPGAVKQLEQYVASAPEGAPNLATAKSLLATLTKKK